MTRRLSPARVPGPPWPVDATAVLALLARRPELAGVVHPAVAITITAHLENA